MNNFKSPEGDNLGSVISFEFVPLSDVERILPARRGILSEVIELKEGKQWFCGYATEETAQYVEPASESPAGTTYGWNFSGFCPGDAEDNLSLFADMAEQLFLVVYKDAEGQKKLIGSLAEGLRFSSSFSTGQTVAARKGHNFSFYRDGSHKSYIYAV